jgi:hypothetical protein
VQRATTDFFATSVQAGDPLLPGAFWVCVSAAPGDVISRVPVHYKLSVGNGIPA